MIFSFCKEKLEELTVIVQFQPAFVYCLCVLHLLSSFMATFGNLLVIHAMWKALSIPATIRPLFLSLAFSDLVIGSCVQPAFATILAVTLHMAAKENFDSGRLCPSVLVSVFAAYSLLGVSFFTIAAIALDRLLAVFLHLRYQQLVTEKRVAIGLVCLWLMSGLSTLAFMSIPSHNDLVALVFQAAGLLVISVAYFRIYKVVRYHQNQIQCQRQVHNDGAMKAARVRKSSLNAFYVYIIALACYLPSLIAGIPFLLDHLHIPSLVAYYFSAILVFLNSTLNPLVYCWRYREIRFIVKRTVKKIFPASHQIRDQLL